MKDEIWMRGEIEVDVSGFFTTHHWMRTDGGVLGELTLSAFSTSGVFRFAGGRELVVQRTSWWRGWHELRESEIVLGTARPLGFWRQKMSVGHRGRLYELVPASFWARSWRLVDDGWAVLVEVEPRGVFRRGAYLTIADSIDVDLLVFAYFLVNVRWQEQAAAAGAAAAGS